MYMCCILTTLKCCYCVATDIVSDTFGRKHNFVSRGFIGSTLKTRGPAQNVNLLKTFARNNS